ncbi:hypothetical protein GRI34_01935 [Erythrobacter aquimaris]|uniref:HEAT repeat domain-containing protein n=1 Tax=Qipengyuania aquimaris TaxID=255984 RepID=A0A6I4THA4_9SPHN|nr:hypothetical protein [Qipengyuania aquimaris]MXO95176.1 hypothetical protein [Qipengyuania aquimaris]
MRIDPELRALRGDRTSQRKAQKALERVRDDWRNGTAREVLEELGSYGEGATFEDCPALCALFDDCAEAGQLVTALMQPMMACLSRNPLGQVPIRHQHSNGLSVLQLAYSGRAALSVLSYSELDFVPGASACFAGGERHEAVLVGSADVRMLELLAERDQSAAIDCTTRRVMAGETLRFEGREQTKSILQVHGRMVILRLSRTEEVPADACEYALEDGRLMHRASGSRQESGREMKAALLGRMGRRDAAPVLARMTREGSDHLRWQAMRECLALDSGVGFAALSDLAGNAGDPLAATAGALRAQLIETYPQLARLDETPCPA